MTPRKAPGPTRPAPGKGYPPKVRTRALDLIRDHGIARAHADTQVPKTTLSRWAKAEGIDVGDQARARTVAATHASRARAAEVTLSTVQLLEEHVAQAGEYLRQVAGVNAYAAAAILAADPSKITEHVGLAGPYITIDDPDADEARRIAAALDSLPLAVRDAEGLLTRAIHDLQLLRGEATERGELTVEFNVPRPTAAPGPVLELDPTDN